MGARAAGRVALMAIHPVYAEAILDGRKSVEFRKRRMAEDIDTVLIYATSPVQKVVGQFNIRRTDVDTPESIWSAYGAVGIIEYDDFFEYYGDAHQAVAFVVGECIRYEHPRPLAELNPAPAIPQSFSYVSAMV
jgi:predicted transcriptional regulator